MHAIVPWLKIVPLALLAYGMAAAAQPFLEGNPRVGIGQRSLVVQNERIQPVSVFEREKPVSLLTVKPDPANLWQQKQSPNLARDRNGPDKADLTESADLLLQQGIDQYAVSQFPEALASWQSALSLYREIGDRAREAKALSNIGLIYEKQGSY
ncbi:MAG: hypothetical protein ABG776_11255, partial [Cyanobacteria bacterium J06555_13]